MTTKTLIAASLIAAVAGTAALADGSRGRGMMPAFDFSAADTDQSGGLTRDEFAAYLQGLQGAVQGQRAQALVEAGDADGDGLLSAEELQVALASQRDGMRERMGERRQGREAHAGRGQEGRGGEGRERGQARMFDRIDANGDEVIDAEELAQAMARMQERMGERRNNG